MRSTTQVTGKENDMIKARIDGVELKISEREPLLAGTVGLNKISLSFSDEWAIFTKQIDFTNEQSGETRRISAEVGVCTVPWELLKAEGDITCYVRGIGSDGRLVLRTNEANLGTVLGSTDGNVPGTGTPTPDVCDETAAKIGDLSKLETNDKSQLVAAINELKRADGLGVFEVTLTAQDGVLTADKTFEQIKAAVADGKPVLKVHSDGDVLWFFLLDKSSAEIDFVGFADEQILAYLTAKQDGSWETTVTARVTVEMLSELSDKLGNLGNLTTTAKNNLVAAINELKSGTAVTEATVSGWGFTKNTGSYSKPTGGIPKDDLAYPVLYALDQAAEAEAHTRNQTRHITDEERTAWNAKQDKLIAGTNITIAADGKTVSVAGGITPLTGTTADVTPRQVHQAILAGTPVVVKYTDGTYGELSFTNFNVADEFMMIVSQTIVYYRDSYVLAELAGSLGGEWVFYSTPLARTDDIPKKTSQLTNDSGFLTDHQDISGKVDKVTGKGLSTNDYTAAAKAKVDAIPASPKYTDTVYDDTAVKNRLTAVENEVAGIGAGSSFSGSYNDLTDKPTIPEAVTEATVSGWGFTKNTGSYSKPTGGIPKTDLASAVQTSLGKADSALQTVPSTYRTASAQDSIDSGKVDKVTGKGLSTNDYTAAAKAKVDAIPASPKYTDTVYDDTAVKSRLAAVEGMETVALTVASGRLTNASYTARYSSLLGMVFVRIYGTVNADMNTGYDYDIMNIGARLPNSHAALAVKSSKAAQAFAKSSGVISLRPLESGIKNYDVYITGFWFA